MSTFVYRYCPDHEEMVGRILYIEDAGEIIKCPQCGKYFASTAAFELSDDFDWAVVHPMAILNFLQTLIYFAGKDSMYSDLAREAYFVAIERIIATSELRKSKEKTKTAAKIFIRFAKAIKIEY